jgi:putative ABC transport system permease protein
MFSPLNIRIGFHLALRQIQRSSLWTTGLIVFIMLLTFLNLVGVTGILVGLVEGIGRGYQQQYTGDVFITPLATQSSIPNSPALVSFLRTLPQVSVVDPRYVVGADVEANYEDATNTTDKINSTGASVVGIDPATENDLSNISHYIIQGSYLSPTDYDQILVGSQLLTQYSFGGPGQNGNTETLDNVQAGTKVRLTIDGIEREFTVKGIIQSTEGNISQRIFMTNSELVAITGANDYGLQEIAIRLKAGEDPLAFKNLLINSGLGSGAIIQTAAEAIPSGVAQITTTFAAIGDVVSSIGLVVASITIFIVIFVNAITRRKFIGILKGIGITGEAIEISYIFQSLFYAISGSGIGLVLLYVIVLPINNAHPIQLPLGNIVIYAPFTGTMLRVGLLVVATMIAGYIPARMIVKRNTLDSILGRN